MTEQKITTRPCIICGQKTTIPLSPQDAAGIREWQDNGVLVQFALPHWSREKRELLLTGMHSVCYDLMAGR